MIVPVPAPKETVILSIYPDQAASASILNPIYSLLLTPTVPSVTIFVALSELSKLKDPLAVCAPALSL